MTVFYVLLYYVWRERYRVKGSNGLTAAVYGLAAVRVILMHDAAEPVAERRIPAVLGHLP